MNLYNPVLEAIAQLDPAIGENIYEFEAIQPQNIVLRLKIQIQRIVGVLLNLGLTITDGLNLVYLLIKLSVIHVVSLPRKKETLSLKLALTIGSMD